MEIEKIIGFISPAMKDAEKIEDKDIVGEDINQNSKLFKMLSDIFNRSTNECDIPIKFVPIKGKQENPIRDEIINIDKTFSVTACSILVKILSSLTDHKTKDGLVFFIKGNQGKNSKIMIARFPAETGITINPTADKVNFDVIDDVFLKNSRKYKAAYYLSKEQFWIGYAIDKQVNEGRGKVKEISDYWIKQFLQSEMKITSQRGTAILAKAVRATLETTEEQDIKNELVTLSTTIKNVNNKTVSFESFFAEMNLSDETKNEVLQKIDKGIQKTKFKIDEEEFRTNCNYLVDILDNGAIVIAPAKEFNDIWLKSYVAEDDEYKYSTTGKPIKSKYQTRVVR